MEDFALFFLCTPRASRSIPSAPMGPGPAVPQILALMSVQCCEPVPLSGLLSPAILVFFPAAPRLILARCPQPCLLPSCPHKRCSQDPSPTSGLPWATLHSPGCLCDSVLAVSKTAIWILADFTNLCVVNPQREVVGCSQGWVSRPSFCHLVCKCPGIVLCALGVCDQ